MKESYKIHIAYHAISMVRPSIYSYDMIKSPCVEWAKFLAVPMRQKEITKERKRTGDSVYESNAPNSINGDH